MQVGVIMGGISAEKEVSVNTGKQIIENLNKDKYEIVPILINNKYDFIDSVKSIQFVFIALHGKFGEDGRIQAILESLGVPYSGCGVLASALCMDKNLSKKLFASEGIKTPKWIIVKDENKIDYSIIDNIGYPIIVKPNSGGSSIGTIIAYSREEVKDGVCEALKYDNEIVIEEYIKGEEITCPILNGEVLPVISINPKSEFFNYSSKYDNGGAEEKIIELPIAIREKVEQISLKCWNTFKLKVYARIDMIIKDEEVYVLEINTLPGMTENSLFPKSANAYGLNFSQLLDKIIQYSLIE
ncbi:D-alanine--D-alanine ligase [Clostridium estertheticum]|uniref:D-alanine--D-alanine ligase n=1 Tax=Clostridium estertheticum TaxID=238834 RepID=UPI0013E90402|nr:D-alanine--D-alanine ligase [Clostridium estertheticum]MBZ9688949.1 D-alanine--D-alanine ligase [Clostridium estertheticum]